MPHHFDPSPHIEIVPMDSAPEAVHSPEESLATIAFVAIGLIVVGLVFIFCANTGAEVEARETIVNQERILGSSFRSIADARAKVRS